MKTPQSRMRMLASWTLAGALGWSSTTAAQNSPYQTAAGTAPAPAAAVQKAAPAPVDAQTRLEAIQIELAWMADRAVFPFTLSVVPAADAFEVRGYVPTKELRDRTLQLARQQTRRPVNDAIKIYPGMTVAPADQPADVLHRGVTQLLAQSMGDAVRGLTIGIRPGGQVVLKGTVSCHEEKVSLGRRLRGLRGCASVVNDLTVVTVLRDGKLYHLISADGQYKTPAHAEVLHVNHTPPQLPSTLSQQAVPAPMLTTTAPTVKPTVAPPPSAPEIKTVSTRSLPEPMPVAPSVPLPTAAAPKGTPNGPRVVMVKMLQQVPGSLIPVEREVPVLLSGTDRMQATRPISQRESSMIPRTHVITPAAPGNVVVNSPSSVPPALPPRPPESQTPPPREISLPLSDRKPVEAVPVQRADHVTPPAAPATPRVVTTSAPAQQTPPAAVRPGPSASLVMPRNTIEMQPAPFTVPITAPRPAPTVVLTPPQPMTQRAPVQPEKQPRPTNLFAALRRRSAEQTPVAPTKGVMSITTEPEAAAPRVTTGVMHFEDDPPATVPTSNAISPAQLRSRIESACAGLTRQVQVTFPAAGQVRIQVTVASVPDAQPVSERLLNLPELSPYEVTLDVQVAP